MIIPDICNVLSASGKEFSLSHWCSPIIDGWVAKIEAQRKHLFQIFGIYWNDSLLNMQVFWDLWRQWSTCPYFVAKKDLHWNDLVDKGKSGYFCQDAKFCSTPTRALDAHPSNVWACALDAHPSNALACQMDGGVGHTAWVPKARRMKSKGLKAKGPPTRSRVPKGP